ncbi:MAG: DsbC family protein [Betaproteobacteria bacterium]|nr:DsbC family protein [Betaproteobacteria bacterium]
MVPSFLVALLAALLAAPALAGADAALAAAREAYPATDVRAARPTPLPGIYEFDMGGESVYGDASARYLILGRMLDMAGIDARLGRRISDGQYRQIRQSAIVLQRGSSGELVIFSDPQCPFCAQLERRLLAGELADHSIYLILVAFQPGSGPQVAGIICASDPAHAYRQATLAGRSFPGGCDLQRMHEHERLARQAGVSATPSLLAPAGYLHPGLPAQGMLRAWVEENQGGN